jgi:UDP-N-acetylmuramoylalanine--D-glutamate ligase
MERIEGHRAILDTGADFRVVCVDDVEIEVASFREMELKNKRVLVVGLARTGVATALFCAARGARVTATESRTEAQIGESVAKLREVGITLELGGHLDETFIEQDLIVPSPGVPSDFRQLMTARKAGVKIWSEIELAYQYLQGSLVGITGSNGKTTTTALIEHILCGAGFPTILAGNIGTPLISVVDQMKGHKVTVVELSSFQLELIDTFRPNVSLFLNLTPDHLDRHHTLKAYGDAKARIFENQTSEDAAILNADDSAAAAYAPSKPRVYWFSRKQRVAQGAYIRGEEVVLRIDGEDHAVLRRGEIPLVGAHNLENVLAAAIATSLVGAAVPAIAAGVRSFAGVEHRLEFVADINGVRYYNDSKATNVDATLKALDAFPGRILIILGGKDKGSDYTVLQQPLREKAILALLIGAAAEKIEQEIAGNVAIERAETLDRAVESAARTAHAGDIVLFAPACASFDQFENYEQRGRIFKDLVRRLPGNPTRAAAQPPAASDSPRR